ncbi:uncharacterized protein LOC124152014 [Haliotis rufescens]|uniref:uncharacterized protein LOC124152014 n=1 Tax=Haliotis rufescens TaxID=6454 RepID=UPI00201F5B98|nr:uncharacterized protein LOC124152014 [Haliotis rufescens]
MCLHRVTCRILTFIIALAATVSVFGDCPPGKYLDTGTTRCDDCADICEHADIQGTGKDCQRLCPGYEQDWPTTTAVPECSSGQYYDKAISQSDYCSVICDNHAIQGTTAQCKEKCPKYFEPKDIQGQQLSSENIAVITVCCLLGLCLILVSVYGLIVCFCEHRLPSRLQRCLPCLVGGYKKPVECTESHTDSPGSSSLTSLSSYEGPTPGSVTIQMPAPEVGLTDLQYQRQSSGDARYA